MPSARLSCPANNMSESPSPVVAYCRNHLNLLMEEPLRTVVESGDEAEAAKELMKLWRGKLDHLAVPPAGGDEPDMAAAEMLLENRLSLTLNSEPFDLGDPVDWRRFSDDHPQLTSHLGYMYWMGPLGAAYAKTGDERYAEKLLQLIESFLRELPYGTDKLPWYPARPAVCNDLTTCNNGETAAVSGQWHSLSCHSRIDAWLLGLSRIRNSPALTLPRLTRILNSLMTEHARLIVSNPRENTPNQYLANSLSLLRLAVAFPEFHVTESYFHIAWSRIERCLSTFVLPDGAMLERSLNYNSIFPEMTRSIDFVLRDAPDTWRAPLKTAARRVAMVLARLTTPDLRRLPVAKTPPDSMVSLARNWGEAFGLPECLRLAGSSAGPLPDCTPSFYLPYGGYAILRDSWDADATQLFFKNSGPSPGHMHEDCLNLGLYANGKDLITEAGNFNYNDTTPLERDMATYCNSTQGHNGILVDGLSQNRTERRFSLSGRNKHQIPNWAFFHRRLPHRASDGHWFATVEGVYEDGFGEEQSPVWVSHIRRIVWIKSLGILVIDRLLPQDNLVHAYQECWHLAPRFAADHIGWDPDKRVFQTQAGEGDLQLSLHVPADVSCRMYHGQDGPSRGWACVGYDRRIPKVDVEFSFSASGPLTVATLIRPISTGEEPFLPEETKSAGAGWSAVFSGDAGRISCHSDGETVVTIQTPDLPEQTLRIPAGDAGLPVETCGETSRSLESIAVDENPKLKRYFGLENPPDFL